MKKPFAVGTNSPASDVNTRTIVDGSLGLWERPAMVAPMAFLRYVHELSAARAELGDEHVFVCVVDSGGESNRSFTLAPGDSVILGRHSKCELQIGHTNVALRQLAVHIAHGSTASRPMMRVWDLHTGCALTCEDGKTVEALASDGPIFLSLGRYHLAIVPLGQLPKTMPVTTSEAWACLPQREFLSVIAEGTGSRLLPRSMGGPAGTTSITRLPSSIGLEALESSVVRPEEALATLVVQGRDKRREFRLSKEHLDRGILVGRYGRCVGSGLDSTVSRVHLMLAAVSGEFIAIDTASTVGSSVHDQKFRSLRLRGPEKISLGKYSYLEWQPAEIT